MGGLCPYKGLGMGVVVRNVVVDGRGDFGHTFEDTATNSLGADFSNQRSTRLSHADEVGIKWR